MSQPQTENAARKGRKWTKVERKAPHFAKPSKGSVYTGMVKAKEQRNGRYGVKNHYLIIATEPGKDERGSWKAGDRILLREYATLRDLDDYLGAEVRVSCLGEREGKQIVDFDIEV